VEPRLRWPPSSPDHGVSGRDQFEASQTLTLNDAEIREALAEPITAIIDLVRKALNETRPAGGRPHRAGHLPDGRSSLIQHGRAHSQGDAPASLPRREPQTAVVRGTPSPGRHSVPAADPDPGLTEGNLSRWEPPP